MKVYLRASIVAIALLTGVPAAVGEVPPPSLPPEFEDVLVTPVDMPTALAFTPDGRLLVATQPGRLFVHEDGQLRARPVLDVSGRTCPRLEQGLLGVAVDPAFEDNGFLYVFYTHNVAGCVHRVSRFTVGDDLVADPASENVLLDFIPSPEGNHNGGDLQFGHDGHLYVSVGDGGCDWAGGGCAGANDASRDLHVLQGKILRITTDGGVPPDNPFRGPDAVPCRQTGRTEPGRVCAETFAWGLRNPFRMAFDSTSPTTRFFINDVGQDHWEEINEGKRGADYGWNVREGSCANGSFTDCGPAPEGMTDPLYAYRHDEACGSITGGAFVPPGAWTDAFDGDYLFSDYNCGTVFRLEREAEGGWRRSPFITGLGPSSAVHLVFGPSPSGTSLYYTTYMEGGQVRRLDHVSTDLPPRAVLQAAPTHGGVPLQVTFDGRDSRSFAPGELTYAFDFGDGSPIVEGTTAMVSHTYTAAGSYTARLSVRDTEGRVSMPASVAVRPGEAPPAVRIRGAGREGRFHVGERIELRGRASDSHDGDLPPERLSWRVLLHHEDHTHPFLHPTPGDSLAFEVPRPESLRAAATSWLEVQLTATDSTGLTSTETVELRPRLVELTFRTDPEGLELVVDGRPEPTPFEVLSWEGLAFPVEAPDQTRSGETYRFESWSDEGGRAHSIVTPASEKKYTADFERAK